MKYINGLIIGLHVIFGSLYAQSAVNSVPINYKYSIPIDLFKHVLYVEKFSPVFIKDLSVQDLHEILQGDSAKKMSEFIDLLEAYNKLYYRRLNDLMQEHIKSSGNFESMKTMYYRDFKETSDTNIRYIIKNDFSIIDLFNIVQNQYSSSFDDDIFNFYIYDRKENIKYKSYNGIDKMLTLSAYYYNLKNNGKLKSLSQDEIEKNIEKLLNKKRKTHRGKDVFRWFTYLAAYMAFLIAINLLANT